MTLNYTAKQRKRIAAAGKIYTKRTKGKDGRYYLSISDKHGQIKRVIWKPSKGHTVKAAEKTIQTQRTDKKRAQKRRQEENELVSLTWEEENTKNQSKAYMEIRLVLSAGSELPTDQKKIIAFMRDNLPASERKKVTLWADIFETHGVAPALNIGKTTESPRLAVDLNVSKGKTQREQLQLDKFL